jgi:anthranilate synthase component II
MILLVDNYDSFSYNLFQLVGAINPDIRVIRNDEYCHSGTSRTCRPVT